MLGGVHIFVDQAVEDGFSADLPYVDVGYGRGVDVAFGVRDALVDALVRPVGCQNCAGDRDLGF